MPVGKWATFDECVQAQIDQGHDEESARKICGKIQKDSHRKSKKRRRVP